ncbi:MAG: hypothetical protein HY537_09870 [Deltaproteobacteria bacterium]|nr:hypothetical protein [Deltaproteobacteria bacterium]
MRILILIAVLWAPQWLLAAQVIQVDPNSGMFSTNHEENRQWALQELACVARDGNWIACGQVVQVESTGAIVQLTGQTEPIVPGDWVASASPDPAAAIMPNLQGDDPGELLKSKEPEREPAVAAIVTKEPEKGPPASKLLNLTGGFTYQTANAISASFLVPAVSLRLAVSEQFALGVVVPIYNSTHFADATSKGYGALLTLNYHDKGPFRGYWIQLGAGLVLATMEKAGEQARSNIFNALGTLGWRWQFGFLSAGAGVGGLFASMSGNGIAASVTQMTPLFLTDFGFSF